MRAMGGKDGRMEGLVCCGEDGWVDGRGGGYVGRIGTAFVAFLVYLVGR